MWRIIVIQNDSDISLNNENLIIKNMNGIFSINISEISVLIIDNIKSKISTYTMFKLSEYNICVIFCDDKHMPISNVIGINSHSRSSKVLESQINVSKVVINNIWKSIIESKIYNQSICLELLNLDYNKVRSISNTVKSNDNTNREAYAAREYFKILFNKDFTRKCDVLFNQCLNYCYSIIRSNIARYCIAYGLNPQMGIHHNNDLNGFNLVDDLIEVFRPMVDMYVYDLLKTDYKELNSKLKSELIHINSYNIMYKNKKYTLDKCISLYVANLKTCIVNNSYVDFETPKIIKLERHRYE